VGILQRVGGCREGGEEGDGGGWSNGAGKKKRAIKTVDRFCGEFRSSKKSGASRRSRGKRQEKKGGDGRDMKEKWSGKLDNRTRCSQGMSFFQNFQGEAGGERAGHEGGRMNSKEGMVVDLSSLQLRGTWGAWGVAEKGVQKYHPRNLLLVNTRNRRWIDCGTRSGKATPSKEKNP